MARMLALLLFLCLPEALPAAALPTAAIVLDTRTGEVYAEDNADARLHPASLTKMMTLYLAFDAVRRGEADLEAETVVSARAAALTGSRYGLRAGQRVRLHALVTATAVMSANDAATALAEAIAGSEAAFVERMNAAAVALGMTRTAFRNPHGLTAEGHLSTARDMSVLARHLYFDFPEYFALFRQVRAEAGGRIVEHTNRRFLESFEGADGIKTGWTSAAGYNLTASAHRGGKRLIVTVFGAPSSVERTRRVSALMEAGFAVAPETVDAVPPRTGRGTPAPEGRRVPPAPLLASLQVGPASGAGARAAAVRGAGPASLFAAVLESPDLPPDGVAGRPREVAAATQTDPADSPPPDGRAGLPDARPGAPGAGTRDSRAPVAPAAQSYGAGSIVGSMLGRTTAEAPREGAAVDERSRLAAQDQDAPGGRESWSGPTPPDIAVDRAEAADADRAETLAETGDAGALRATAADAGLGGVSLVLFSW